ncbi:inositol monophosphatase family protein [Bosea sp. 2KB_26]|uniref:inositol monophosphatase family protein n=1 Tax=Bosea sp. 2KB_26 TaxID=3237475 RepID=UPI003F93EED4
MTSRTGGEAGMRSKEEEDSWLAFAWQLAQESGSILREAATVRPDVEVKPDRSFVTALDARIERRLRERIADRFPSHGIIGEEEASANSDADLVWVLDPIDGTAAFIAGLPVYGTLIALMREGEPIIGIIDHPVTGDRWIGVKGRPTLHNGTPCRTRACGALDEAILSASNPDFFDDEERPALDAMRAATAWRIWGGACMSFGLLASGRTDAAFDTRMKLWDFAPFRPIIEGAGGVITDWEGQPLTHKTGKRIMAAGDPERHREMLRLVETSMKH